MLRTPRKPLALLALAVMVAVWSPLAVNAAQEREQSERLTALLLQSSDIASHLALDPQLSGPLTAPGVQAQVVTYAADARALPPGAVYAVNSIVYDFADDLGPDALDRMASGSEAAVAQTGLIRGDHLDIAPVTVGEISRTRALPGEENGVPMTIAYVLFRRNGLYGYVAVSTVGEVPASAELQRLAQVMDGRLVAAR